jgi:hypothetical protein
MVCGAALSLVCEKRATDRMITVFFRYALVLASGGAIAEFIGVPQKGHLFSKACMLSEM